MTRSGRVIAAGLALAAMLAVAASTRPTGAQDDVQATIEAQQTTIAELETRVAELEAAQPSSTATPQESEAGGDVTPFLGGNAHSLLGPGEPGELSLVAFGTYDGNTLPLIIRNNTDRAVVRVTVSAVGRDANGQLIAAGGDQGFDPNLVPPGDYTLGYVYFDGVSLPPDTTFEFEVTATDAASQGSFGRLDLELSEASFLGDRVVGILRNGHDVQVTGPIGVSVFCLDAEGGILGRSSGFTDKDQAAPGDTVPFQVNLYGAVDCTNFLVAASGFSF